MRRSRVHITGASGSGTTTLARALANRWAVPHADVDDYFWVPSDPPYRVKRPAHERTSLMQSIFVAREAWVLSGSLLGWGESIADQCAAVIFLTLPQQERLERLEARELARRADGEFDEPAWIEFMEWAKGYDDPAFDGRSRRAHEMWLSQLSVPILRLDSRRTVDELVEDVLQWPAEITAL